MMPTPNSARTAREGVFDYGLRSSLASNLRMDPFEQRDGVKSRELAMRLGIAFGVPVMNAIGAHLCTLKELPPRQEG
jgi:hypothetical protein